MCGPIASESVAMDEVMRKIDEALFGDDAGNAFVNDRTTATADTDTNDTLAAQHLRKLREIAAYDNSPRGDAARRLTKLLDESNQPEEVQRMIVALATDVTHYLAHGLKLMVPALMVLNVPKQDGKIIGTTIAKMISAQIS